MPPEGTPMTMKDATSEFDVLAIGNALVDVLAQEPDSFLDDHSLIKGSMTLIDALHAEALYDAMGPGVEVSGGSAANTTVGISSFGEKRIHRSSQRRSVRRRIRSRYSRCWRSLLNPATKTGPLQVGASFWLLQMLSEQWAPS